MGCCTLSVPPADPLVVGHMLGFKVVMAGSLDGIVKGLYAYMETIPGCLC